MYICAAICGHKSVKSLDMLKYLIFYFENIVNFLHMYMHIYVCMYL